MARGKLFLIFSLFLGSCAEIQPLSGGEEDDAAPKPVAGKQNPEQGAITFMGSELTVTFNEYFTLKDPSKTVEMNPSCGTISVEQKNKNITIKWAEQLAPNTTYSITLDGTVVDLTEKNDTIHQFVFSTGMLIDSAKIDGKCIDAFSNSVLQNATIYLFEKGQNPNLDSPKFKTRSDKNGNFHFSYLPENSSFGIFAFVDGNKNSKQEENEKIAFSKSVLTTDSSNNILSFFKEKTTETKFSVQILEPGKVILSGKNVKTTKINGNELEILKSYNSDSLLAFLPTNTASYSFILDSDTVVKSANTKLGKLLPKFNLVQFRTGDTLRVEYNDRIKTIQKEKITVSKGATIEQIQVLENEDGFSIPISSNWSGAYSLFSNATAVEGKFSSSDSSRQSFSVLTEEELAILKLNFSNFQGKYIVQLVDGTKTIATKTKNTDENSIRFERLIPGNYTIRCIEDLDGNGEWTSGSSAENRQAENVYYFKLSQKLKGNWEVEQSLDRK